MAERGNEPLSDSGEAIGETDWQLFAIARRTCTGDYSCTSYLHIHGCHADIPPAKCTMPDEHHRVER